jgi:REP-associated tyrosine transposase
MSHHVTQRGNPSRQTFFGEEDFQHYLELISRFCRSEQVATWAYCLIPNHVHLIVVPQSAESLRRAIGEAHRRYTRWINFREGWRGCLWQARFASFVMDEDHLLIAARYVELNPVRGGSVQAPSCYRWSSAPAHLKGRDDALVQVAPLLQMAPNWRRLFTSSTGH